MQNPNGLRDINIEEGGWSFACVSMYVIVKSFKQLEPLKTHTRTHTQTLTHSQWGVQEGGGNLISQLPGRPLPEREASLWNDARSFPICPPKGFDPPPTVIRLSVPLSFSPSIFFSHTYILMGLEIRRKQSQGREKSVPHHSNGSILHQGDRSGVGVESLRRRDLSKEHVCADGSAVSSYRFTENHCSSLKALLSSFS